MDTSQQRPSDPPILVVVPARFDASRLPGKALLPLAGEPMVWHVVQRVEAAAVGPVVVATDDERIREAVERRGGRVVMTSPTCRNGTERVAEVAQHHPGTEILVDVQGDEPLLDIAALRALCRWMTSRPDAAMATLAFPLEDPDGLHDRHVVKVEQRDGVATAFWRLPPQSAPVPDVQHHAGIYAFRRDALLRIASWSPTRAETAVSLEQLRALDNGVAIHVVGVERGWPSVNTALDLERVRAMLEGERGGRA
jgi:3-deoxy-manno-octulosonate cytidylyltransferase (CMP-KDO synthetase)